MQVMWCWRCGRDIPMLDPEEIELVWRAHDRGLALLDAESIRRIYQEHAGDTEGLQNRLEFERKYGGMLQEYKRITGYHETNPMAIWHHRIGLYGPPCAHCGKPLRTPQAKRCGACMGQS